MMEILFIQSLGGIISTNIGTLIINDGGILWGNGGNIPQKWIRNSF